MCAFRFVSACSNVCFLVPFGMLQGCPKSITVDIFMFQGALGQSAWTERSSYKNKCFVACFFIVGFSVLILQCSELVSDARCSSNTYCTASAYLQLMYISSSPLYVLHSWLGIFERLRKLHGHDVCKAPKWFKIRSHDSVKMEKEEVLRSLKSVSIFDGCRASKMAPNGWPKKWSFGVLDWRVLIFKYLNSKWPQSD